MFINVYYNYGMNSSVFLWHVDEQGCCLGKKSGEA